MERSLPAVLGNFKIQLSPRGVRIFIKSLGIHTKWHLYRGDNELGLMMAWREVDQVIYGKLLDRMREDDREWRSG